MIEDGWEGTRDRLWTIEVYGITSEQEEQLSSVVFDIVSDLCDKFHIDWSGSCGPIDEEE